MTNLTEAASVTNDVLRDQYGRDAAERTVELKPYDAEAINKEVVVGKWQTYDDALSYVVGRGLAEISRQRKAAAELRDARFIKAKGKDYSHLLKLKPELVNDRSEEHT